MENPRGDCRLRFEVFPETKVQLGNATTRHDSDSTFVIDGVKYAPETLTVKRGDTVVWVNKDPFSHTVTAKGSFDSQSIAAGKSWKWTPRKAGDFAYICTLHPNMTGALKVE